MVEMIDKKIADLDFDIKCHLDAIERAKVKKALWEELKTEAAEVENTADVDVPHEKNEEDVKVITYGEIE